MRSPFLTSPLPTHIPTTSFGTTNHPLSSHVFLHADSHTPFQIHRLVAPRDQKHQSNFVEFRGSSKIVYRRYAGLFFCACVDANDNELAYLEAIHFFVEVLDQFFGNVCELDLVFNFYKVSRTSKMRGRKVVEGGEEREEGTRKRFRRNRVRE